MSRNPWEAIVEHIRRELPEEEYRRWFGATAYASDSGDQITVWVQTEAVRRHLQGHFADAIDRALAAIERGQTHIRFVVSGTDEDDEDVDE
jgi:chromosomal replication initiation ATPase DnaA